MPAIFGARVPRDRSNASAIHNSATRADDPLRIAGGPIGVCDPVVFPGLAEAIHEYDDRPKVHRKI
jgi:hypothetical protein